jgi:hypothetical protein
MAAFDYDGDYSGILYRVLPDSSIDAMLPTGLVNFKNIDQFMASAINNSVAGTLDLKSNGMLEVTNGQRANIPAKGKPLDYYSILLDAIHKTEQNSAQLRTLVYERARFNIKREFLFEYSSLGLSEIVQHVKDFELAVARIEASAVNCKPSGDYRGQLELRDIDRSLAYTGVQIIPANAAPLLYEEDGSLYYQLENPRVGLRPNEAWPYFRRAILLVGSGLAIIAFIGAATIAGTLWHSLTQQSQFEIARKSGSVGVTATSANNTLEESARPEIKSPKPSFPLPSSFGIYALSDNKLFKLEALPIRVPDSRVALSAEIAKPSITTISSNKPAFILFRRDLQNNASEKVALRVVARVVHETKFVGGKPSIVNLEGSWRVRGTSIEYKVSPISGQPEMVMAHTDDSQSLAAGRYVLILNGVGFDFTIEGSIQASAHCLEEFEALNGTVFSECPKAPSANHTNGGI